MDNKDILEIATTREAYGCNLCEFQLETIDGICERCHNVSKSELVDYQDMEDARMGCL